MDFTEQFKNETDKYKVVVFPKCNIICYTFMQNISLKPAFVF